MKEARLLSLGNIEDCIRNCSKFVRDIFNYGRFALRVW